LQQVRKFIRLLDLSRKPIAVRPVIFQTAAPAPVYQTLGLRSDTKNSLIPPLDFTGVKNCEN